MYHIAVKIRITPWAARVVHSYRLIDFDFTVYGLSRCKCYLAKWYTNPGMNFAASVNLSRIETRSAPASPAATRRGFTFYVDDPITSIAES